jgi:hypothetical protein
MELGKDAGGPLDGMETAENAVDHILIVGGRFQRQKAASGIIQIVSGLGDELNNKGIGGCHV